MAKQRPARLDTPPPAPTLREFWAQLQREKSSGAPLSAVPSPAAPPPNTPAVGAAPLPASPAAAPPPSRGDAVRGSGEGFGSGSGGAGYGLRLVAPDPLSQQRIMTIMKSLCEKDAGRDRRI